MVLKTPNLSMHHLLKHIKLIRSDLFIYPSRRSDYADFELILSEQTSMPHIDDRI